MGRCTIKTRRIWRGHAAIAARAVQGMGGAHRRRVSGRARSVDPVDRSAHRVADQQVFGPEAWKGAGAGLLGRTGRGELHEGGSAGRTGARARAGGRGCGTVLSPARAPGGPIKTSGRSRRSPASRSTRAARRDPTLNPLPSFLVSPSRLLISSSVSRGSFSHLPATSFRQLAQQQSNSPQSLFQPPSNPRPR